MSDLSIYELEDIWDDFERSGDHIVPEPTSNHDNEDKSENDSCKKPRLEVTPVQNDEEENSKTLDKENNMMEKDSWSHIHIPDGVLTASGDADSAKVTPTLQSGTELCTDEGINDLNLFSNYGWPDIGNFEDFDRILSNCDSSYGLGITENDDELLWFTSEDPSREYEQGLKMDVKFPCSEASDLTKVSQDHKSQGSDSKRSSFVSSESENEFKLKDQNQTEGNKERRCYGLKSNNHISSSNESGQVLTSIYNQQQNKIIGHNSVDYMKTNPYLHSNPNPHHNYVPIQSTGIKFKNTGPTRKETFNPPVENSGNQKQVLQKQFHMEKGFESQSDMKLVNRTELGSLDVPEGSSISSELDEISLEATGFRQLMQVMEQLDLRTKLCIRDSLYRLARSAEQRHNYAGISDSTTTGGPLTPQGTNNKYTELMDMETDTNPIDRTIAHLLFHRPSESSKMPTPVPLKPNVKFPGPTTVTTPMVVENQQMENESDDKISSTGKNNVSLGRHARNSKVIFYYVQI